MPKCIDCGDYTKYNGGRCFSCHDEFIQNVNFRINLTKGKIAETIIEQMLFASDFDVHRFGMENTVPKFMESFYDFKDDTANKIRSMPDFIVNNPKNNDQTYFLEVKYRSNGQFRFEDLGDNYAYMEGLLVLVTKERILGITVKELKKVGFIDNKSKRNLIALKEFNGIEESVVQTYEKIAAKVFKEL